MTAITLSGCEFEEYNLTNIFAYMPVVCMYIFAYIYIGIWLVTVSAVVKKEPRAQRAQTVVGDLPIRVVGLGCRESGSLRGVEKSYMHVIEFKIIADMDHNVYMC